MEDSTVLRGLLSDGTIAFHALFAKAFRSLPIGVFLSQGYFWQENSRYRNEKTHVEIEGKMFFAKTGRDWFEETSLTIEQQTKAREVLCNACVLEEKLFGNPARLYYHINLKSLVSVLNRYLVSGISASVDNRNKNGFKTQTRRSKKPKLESVKNRNYNKESIESNESEGEVLPPSPALKVEISDPEIPGVKVVDFVEPTIQLGHRPNAKTPLEIEDALREFYTQYPNEWKFGILENGKGKKYSKDRRVEIVKDFCCYAITKNWGGDTYGQLNAALQSWFRSEQFATWKNPENKGSNTQNQDAVYEPPKIPVRQQ